ncbi:hypothetical protein [Yersinia enterocolitica]|uniref:hypothetical protein n=1 Tax=Yersinia enterocolitica TaxID=630 RepID=UPI00227AD4C7|nr:hypothetical protein [Yersinia enterocolitica]MCY1688157.1 hypothetical protein [Yersinia enterocolitica]
MIIAATPKIAALAKAERRIFLPVQVQKLMPANLANLNWMYFHKQVLRPTQQLKQEI